MVPRRKSPLWQWASAFVAFAWFGWASYLTVARPITPEPTRGYTWPMPAHGPPVYVTTAEMISLWAVPLVGFGLLYCAWRLFARD